MRDSGAAGCAIAFAWGVAGAVLVGVPTFSIAFYTSLGRHPDSPQAPLLAFLFFGPVGAFIGFIAGALLSQRRKRK